MAVRVPALELPLALVRNVPVLKRAIFRQAGFTWRGVDNVAVLVSLALLVLPIDKLAAELAVFLACVRHWYPIRTIHRYRSFSSIGKCSSENISHTPVAN
jgi:hypothetical protein